MATDDQDPAIYLRGFDCGLPVKDVVGGLRALTIAGDRAYLVHGLIKGLQRLYSALVKQRRTTDLDGYEVVLVVVIRKKGAPIRINEGE